MGERAYVDFDITVRRVPAGGYTAEADFAGSHTASDFNCPFDEAEREAVRSIVQGPVRDFGEPGGRRGNAVDYWEQMKIRGEQLYDALFKENVRASFVACCNMARSQQEPHGVRLRLHLDNAPELADLPWEYLYDSARGTFLALGDFIAIVRHLNQVDPVQLPRVTPPLNMLVMISRGQPPLDVESEWNKIRAKLAPLQDKQLLSLTRVDATIDDLQDCLSTKKMFHIFHFIGHGGFDAVKNPVLRLDDSDMTAEQIVPHLDSSSLRLAVLNSCDGARAAKDDGVSVFAHRLVKAGIPAVVAMQFKITDRAAIDFAGGIYRAIASDLPIEISVASGRKAILGRDNNPTEWGTPVLFMRGNGRLFSLEIPSEQQARQREIDALARQARLALDEKQYDIAIQQLLKIKERLAALFA